MTRSDLRTSWVCAAALCMLAACGPTFDDGFDEMSATLQVEPAASEHVILNGVPARQAFKAMLVDRRGRKLDVTAETVFSIDARVGVFAGLELTMIGPGKTTVNATWQDLSGSAQLIARVKLTRIEPPLPLGTPELFEQPEQAGRGPALLYPPDGAVVPRNLGDFEAHWTDAYGHDVFEVSLKSELSDVRVYVRGGNGVPAAGPSPSWQAFNPAEWLAAVGEERSLTYQVRGASTANPTYVGAAAPREVRVSNEDLQGGLYYWASQSANGGAAGVFRHDMSKPGQPAEEFMTTNQTAGRCVACHVLSRDGKKMAVTYDGGDNNGTLIEVASRFRQPDTTQWNFATFTPDASRVLTVFQGTVAVRSTADQSVIATMPAGGFSTHPDLSADGKRLVYVRAASGADYSFVSGKIFTRSFDQATSTFGPETPLVVDGINNFYPSWSPDGKWVLFNRSDSNAYNNVNASLWVVKADGTAPAIQLAAFNQAAGGLTNSWGRWAPFAQTVGPNREPIFWITVSSKRDFGARLVNRVQTDENLKTPQIWMAPFFIGRAMAGQDPTAPAFRLPFQNLSSNNHIAQWTERIVVTF